MKNIVSLIIAFSFSLTLAQNYTDWQNHTDMKKSTAISVLGDSYWASTEGGAYKYSFTTDSYFKLSKSEGLNGIVLTAATIDKYGKIWLGSNRGIIDIYNPETGQFKSLLDIFNSDKTTKTINHLYAAGDTIYAATDFGVVVIDAKNLVFIDTYLKFGTFSSNIKVKSVYKKDILYLSTESGVAIQKIGTTNPAAPEAWDVFSTLAPGQSSNTKKLVSFENQIIAASASGISSYNGSIWQYYIPQLSSTNIIDLLVVGDSLFVQSESVIYKYYSGVLEERFTSSTKMNSLAYSATRGLLAATNSGVIVINNSEVKFPNGPAANQFPNMTVDATGKLWSGSGKNNAGKGIYYFDGNSWGNFNVSNTPSIGNNDYFSIYAANDNTIYSGNWGAGFVRIKDDSIVRFDATNTNMQGFPGDPNFLLIGGFTTDSKGNLWILNVEASDRKTLAMLTPDSSWHFFTIPAEQNLVLKLHDNLVIDQFETKWFSSNDERKSGLFYFNENKTFTNFDDDFSGYLSSSDSSSNRLNSNNINSIVVDRRGDVWVGTGLGINIITNTSTALSSNPQLRISSVFSVRQQSVNAIAVDPLNQKWIGTNQGLFLLNSDGSRLLSVLDTKNSSLLSDKIESIAIDEINGKIYVGSEAGLTSFQTLALKPLDSFDEIFAFPNPITIVDGSENLTIDRLVRDSNIKILSVSGKLIRELSTPGGRRANWNLKDDQGNIVSSGIYIIVASDSQGNNVAKGKVAVLRK